MCETDVLKPSQCLLDVGRDKALIKWPLLATSRQRKTVNAQWRTGWRRRRRHTTSITGASQILQATKWNLYLGITSWVRQDYMIQKLKLK